MREESLWPPVCRFPTAERGLARARLEACRRSGSLYADRGRNAASVCRYRHGAVRGAFLAGTRDRPGGGAFKGMAPGSREVRVGFWLATGRGEPRSIRPTAKLSRSPRPFTQTSPLSLPAVAD